MDYAQSEGLAASNVAKAVKLPKASYVTKGWLHSNEIGPFLDCCQLVFRMLVVFTGLRWREVVFLQRGDVDLRNGVIQIRSKPLWGFTTKNGKDRSVPIDPAIAPMLQSILSHLPKRLDALNSWPRKYPSSGATSARCSSGPSRQTPTQLNIRLEAVVAATSLQARRPYWLQKRRTCGASRDRTGDLLNAI